MLDPDAARSALAAAIAAHERALSLLARAERTGIADGLAAQAAVREAETNRRAAQDAYHAALDRASVSIALGRSGALPWEL